MDNRIFTFLKLCEIMNYRKTAEYLHMTQPAVTQHIHFLEDEYSCRLFDYSDRVLKITEHGRKLERYFRSAVYNENKFKEELKKPTSKVISIGATKTIGDYTFADKFTELMQRDDIKLKVIIDNTENLLNMLNSFQLDILLIEGFIDKQNYGSKLIKKEELVGICSKNHRFAGKKVPPEEIFKEHLILREQGSGTRAVFQIFLNEKGFSENCFVRVSEISSFRLITKAVSEGIGVSFVYKSIVENNPDISYFTVSGEEIFHEFNFVFLKNTEVEQYLQLLY